MLIPKHVRRRRIPTVKSIRSPFPKTFPLLLLSPRPLPSTPSVKTVKPSSLNPQSEFSPSPSPILSSDSDESTFVGSSLPPNSQASTVVGSGSPTSSASALIPNSYPSPASDTSKELNPSDKNSDDDTFSDGSASALKISHTAPPNLGSSRASNVPEDSSSLTTSSQPPPSSRYATRSQNPDTVSKEDLTCFHYDGGNYLLKALSDHNGKEMVDMFWKWNDAMKEMKGMKKVYLIIFIHSIYLSHCWHFLRRLKLNGWTLPTLLKLSSNGLGVKSLISPNCRQSSLLNMSPKPWIGTLVSNPLFVTPLGLLLVPRPANSSFPISTSY